MERVKVLVAVEFGEINVRSGQQVLVNPGGVVAVGTIVPTLRMHHAGLVPWITGMVGIRCAYQALLRVRRDQDCAQFLSVRDRENEEEHQLTITSRMNHRLESAAPLLIFWETYLGPPWMP